MSPAASEATQPWYRQFWPWFIIGLPASAVVAGVATLIIAASGNDALVVADYNRIEELTAQTEARNASAAALGLVARVTMSERWPRIDVNVTATARPDLRWQPERLRLNIGHPTRKAADRTVLLERTGPNLYSGRLDEPLVGRRYIELLPEPAQDELVPEWRLAGEWTPGRGAHELSAQPRP